MKFFNLKLTKIKKVVQISGFTFLQLGIIKKCDLIKFDWD